MSYSYGLKGHDLIWNVVKHLTKKKMSLGEHEQRYSGKNWSIVHHQGLNSVSIQGRVPMSFFSSDYLLDWAIDTTNPRRIFKELQRRINENNEQSPSALASTHLSNTAGVVIYKLTDDELIAGLLTDRCLQLERCSINYTKDDPTFRFQNVDFSLHEFLRACS